MEHNEYLHVLVAGDAGALKVRHVLLQYLPEGIRPLGEGIWPLRVSGHPLRVSSHIEKRRPLSQNLNKAVRYNG